MCVFTVAGGFWLLGILNISHRHGSSLIIVKEWSICPPVNVSEYVVLSACFKLRALFSLLHIKVSHDFAVNFDEDNPECAGEQSSTLMLTL